MKPSLILLSCLSVSLMPSLLAIDSHTMPGKEFREAISSRYKVRESGLKYKVIKRGEGVSPVLKDEVTVHYVCMLEDGTVVDSSRKRGEKMTFRLEHLIKGWQEGLQLMRPGAKFSFIIPSDLAYGERGAGKIPPNATLHFEVELFTVK